MEVRQASLSALPPRVRQTFEDVLGATTPNLYLTQKARQVLGVSAPLAPLRTYQFPSPIDFHAARIPIKDILSHPDTRLALEVIGPASDFGSKVLEADHGDAASALQGVSVFVGAYGCIDRMMNLEKYGRKRQVLCFAELALSVLIFLGRFIPQIKDASLILLGVKVLTKVGDKYEERTYGAREGRAMLRKFQFR